MIVCRDRLLPRQGLVGVALGVAACLLFQWAAAPPQPDQDTYLRDRIQSLQATVEKYRSVALHPLGPRSDCRQGPDAESSTPKFAAVTPLASLPPMSSLSTLGRTRVCLVTSAFSGPTTNGGIARAFHSLAMHMVQAGNAFEVTVLYAAHPWYGDGTADQWVQHFKKYSIRFVPLPEPRTKFYGPKLLIRSFCIFEWLKQHENQFDLVSYHDHMGNGYFTALAKRQGLGFAKVQLVIQCHSTIRWADELNSRGPKDHNTLAYYYMEQKAVEWADVRVSPSRYYLDWYVDAAGHNISGGVSYVLPNTMFPVPAEVQRAEVRTSTHLAFFGRLESRKGLSVFLDAVDIAITMGVSPLYVSFIGPEVSIGGLRAASVIRKHTKVRGWPFPVVIETGFNTQDAIAYLVEHHAVAILPSLGDNSPYTVMEVAAKNIPMITTDAGGAKELLNYEEADNTVVRAGEPEPLARSMVQAMTSGIKTMTLQMTFEETAAKYLHLLKSVHAMARHKPKTPPHPRKTITVGITSHDRPASLLAGARSIVEQQYPAELITLVVIDDASTHPNIATALNEIKELCRGANMKVVIEQRAESSFVAKTRNQLIAMAEENGSDYICFLDDDDTAKPYMLSAYMGVAERTDADVLTDFSDNYDVDTDGKTILSHISTALGNSFAHNFFINNYGKANFCVRPGKALAIGGHQTGKHSHSPYVDWGFLTRASLNDLRIEILPMALYNYYKHSSGSIWYGMTTQRHRYDGHQKMLDDIQADLPAKYRDILMYCRYKLASPSVASDGPV